MGLDSFDWPCGQNAKPKPAPHRHALAREARSLESWNSTAGSASYWPPLRRQLQQAGSDKNMGAARSVAFAFVVFEGEGGGLP